MGNGYDAYSIQNKILGFRKQQRSETKELINLRHMNNPLKYITPKVSVLSDYLRIFILNIYNIHMRANMYCMYFSRKCIVINTCELGLFNLV